MHLGCAWRSQIYESFAVHTIHKKATDNTTPPVALRGTGIKFARITRYKPRCPEYADRRCAWVGGFGRYVRIDLLQARKSKLTGALDS